MKHIFLYYTNIVQVQEYKTDPEHNNRRTSKTQPNLFNGETSINKKPIIIHNRDKQSATHARPCGPPSSQKRSHNGALRGLNKARRRTNIYKIKIKIHTCTPVALYRAELSSFPMVKALPSVYMGFRRC